MNLEGMMPGTEPVLRHEIDRRLLEVLVCPLTRGPLVYDRANNELISHQARRAYPVRDGVPIMLAGEARVLGVDE